MKIAENTMIQDNSLKRVQLSRHSINFQYKQKLEEQKNEGFPKIKGIYT